MTSAPGPSGQARRSPHPYVPRNGGRHVSSYDEGRTCAEPGCDTTLSRYNKHALCAVHTAGPRGT
jgi:hypothetical protein